MNTITMDAAGCVGSMSEIERTFSFTCTCTVDALQCDSAISSSRRDTHQRGAWALGAVEEEIAEHGSNIEEDRLFGIETISDGNQVS